MKQIQLIFKRTFIIYDISSSSCPIYLSVFWLDGFRNYNTAIYSIIVSILFMRVFFLGNSL